SYHPKMILKIILYAYTQSVFSGRKIEKLLHDSIRMMWLAQNHESKLNENSKALYRDLVEEKIIPEIKEDGDSDLTIEEIDL
ncbi:transposase, partial [Staphylococcus aureus]